MTQKYDVVVVGGGAAGSAAAIGAARLGAKVLLLEMYGFLGGMMTSGYMNETIVFTTPSGRILLKGVYMEILGRLKELGATSGILPSVPYGIVGNLVIFEPEYMKYVLQEMVLEAGVTLVLHAKVVDAVVEDGTIQGVVAETASGRTTYSGQIVVDASWDGVLAARARAPFEKGRDPDGILQVCGFHYRMANVDLDKVTDYMREHPDEFIWTEHKYLKGDPSELDKLPDAHLHVHGFLKQLEAAVEAGEYVGRPDRVMFWCMPPLREGHVVPHTIHVSADVTDAEDLTRAEIEARRQLINNVSFLQKYIPGFEDSYLVAAADQVQFRETRRIIGEYMVTEQDIGEDARFPDKIGEGCAFINLHEPDRVLHVFAKESYDLPYRCLVPLEIDNLLVAGKASSLTYEASTVTRYDYVAMQLGQAAGVAAALSAATNVTPRQLDHAAVQEALVDQAALDLAAV